MCQLKVICVLFLYLAYCYSLPTVFLSNLSHSHDFTCYLPTKPIPGCSWPLLQFELHICTWVSHGELKWILNSLRLLLNSMICCSATLICHLKTNAILNNSSYMSLHLKSCALFTLVGVFQLYLFLSMHIINLCGSLYLM